MPVTLQSCIAYRPTLRHLRSLSFIAAAVIASLVASGLDAKTVNAKTGETPVASATFQVAGSLSEAEANGSLTASVPGAEDRRQHRERAFSGLHMVETTNHQIHRSY